MSRFRQEFPNEPSNRYTDCPSYDILPTTAFIQGIPVYSLAASWGMRYVFTGGEDGFIRKYDLNASINGAQLLTVSQKHMLPDTITKGGVLAAYWENEQPQEEYKLNNDSTYLPQLSPVFSLVAQSEALWVCAGLESGGISIQSASYGEPGQVLGYLRDHNKVVSDIQLSSCETDLLSGSWDKSVMVWDLNTGVASHASGGLAGQVSSVDWQPLWAPIVPPRETDDTDDDKSMESLFGLDDEKEGESREEPENETKQEGDHQNPDPKLSNQEDDKNENLNEEGMAGDDKNADNNEQSAEKQPTGNVYLSATFNGVIELWDKRQPERISWLGGSQSPPWCMSACFSTDGSDVFAGRRNACVEGWDLRKCNRPSRTLKFPTISGAVSCVTRMPNNRSLLCASLDNIRMYDLKSDRKTPFTIIPGHHGSVISKILVDKSGRYMVSACGGRGWVENMTDVVLAYEVTPE